VEGETYIYIRLGDPELLGKEGENHSTSLNEVENEVEFGLTKLLKKEDVGGDRRAGRFLKFKGGNKGEKRALASEEGKEIEKKRMQSLMGGPKWRIRGAARPRKN